MDAAAVAVLLLAFGRSDSPKRLYPLVYVLVIKGSAAESTIHDHCAGELSALLANADQDTIKKILQARLRVRSAVALEFDTIIGILTEMPEDSALIVVNAAMYRPSRAVEGTGALSGHITTFGERIRTVIEEDEWSTALAELPSHLEDTAERKRIYISLLAGDHYPILEKNLQKLHSIKGALFGGRHATDDDDEGHVIQNAEQWIEMVSGDMEDAAFAEIEALKMSNLNQALVKAQCLFVAQRSLDGFELLRPFLTELRSEGSQRVQVNVARIAFFAGEHAESLGLLDAAIAAAPADEPTLRAIHQHARTMGAKAQEERALELLRQRFPRHTYTLSIEVERCVRRREYARIIEILGTYDEQAEAPEYFRYALALANGLGGPFTWPYHGVIGEVAIVAPDSAEKAVLHCAEHALNHGEIDVAIRLLLVDQAWDKTEAKEVTKIIMRAARKWAITMPSPHDSEDVQQQHQIAFSSLVSALPFAINYLARSPEDAQSRIDLIKTLAPSSMDTLGLGILVHLLKIADSATIREATEQEAASHEPVSYEQYSEFFEKYFKDWDGSALVGAPAPLPRHLVSEPLQALKHKAINLAHYAAARADTDATDKSLLFMHFRIALDLTNHLGNDSELFELLRMIASARANAGMFQDARDFAEHALLMLGEHRSAAQQRAAWLVYADAYARCGNICEAILGWLCAAQHQDIELTPSRKGQDMLLYVRLLRDAGLRAEALAQLRIATEILERSPLKTEIRSRIEHLEATIRLPRGSRLGELDAEREPEVDLDRLAELSLVPLASALETKDDLFPPATFVAQVLALHDQRGRTVPDALRETFERAVEAVHPDEAARLRLLANATPGRQDLLMLCRTLGGTRFSGDLDLDLRHVRLLARRALDGLILATDAEGALLAIELLATHALEPNGPIETLETEQRESILEDLRASTAARVLDTTDEKERATLGRLLVQLNGPDGMRESTTVSRLVAAPGITNEVVDILGLHGIDVHALALSSRGRLVRVSAMGGRRLDPIEENTSTFNKSKLEKWRKDYPFHYCAPDGREDNRGTISHLEESLNGIGTSAESPTGGTVYLMSHDLADLPANLVRVNDACAGDLGPTASVPSLTWLHATLRMPRPPTGRRTAWILPASETTLSLVVLRDNLGVTLEKQGFEVVTDVQLPRANRGGDLAIVGAHGAIWFNKGIFRNVSDDEKTIRYSMTEFAAQLSDTAVVVLLVCSGGRLDSDILSGGVAGLPYELLRRGCRAVVGSPWPINVNAANRWAEHFVAQWDAGETVIDATYHANEDLRHWRRGELHSLAMNVFGNPLERSPLRGSPRDPP